MKKDESLTVDVINRIALLEKKTTRAAGRGAVDQLDLQIKFLIGAGRKLTNTRGEERRIRTSASSMSSSGAGPQEEGSEYKS